MNFPKYFTTFVELTIFKFFQPIIGLFSYSVLHYVDSKVGGLQPFTNSSSVDNIEKQIANPDTSQNSKSYTGLSEETIPINDCVGRQVRDNDEKPVTGHNSKCKANDNGRVIHKEPVSSSFDVLVRGYQSR